jgi:hypothetical protein
MKFVEELKWKLFMAKVNWGLMKTESVRKYMRKNYCRYGMHKLKSGWVTHQKDGKRKTYIRYLHCQFCNYRFFARKCDLNKYEQLTKVTSALSGCLSSGKPKQDLYPLVDNLDGDVSVRNRSCKKEKHGK